jgi:2,4-dienoyl-CoA reductase-like NADH-dependent reductase (Old Yellow Enzyme family)
MQGVFLICKVNFYKVTENKRGENGNRMGGTEQVNSKYAPLLESFTFKNGVQLKNRMVMAPMTNWSSNPDGTVTEDEVNYYARRSSGVGMVITACTYVTANGKGFHGEFGGDRDELIPSLQKVATGIKEQ